jgi:hypothetical protein
LFDLRKLGDGDVWIGRQKRETVGFGYVENMVGRQEMGGSGHILNDHSRLAGEIFTKVVCHDLCSDREAATFRPNVYIDGLAFVEICLSSR